MGNETTKRLVKLKTDIKSYENGVSIWIERLGVTKQAFRKYFEDSAVTDRKKEVYKVGLKLLSDLKKQEVKDLERMEMEVH
jgi:hypothetical protein